MKILQIKVPDDFDGYNQLLKAVGNLEWTMRPAPRIEAPRAAAPRAAAPRKQHSERSKVKDKTTQSVVMDHFTPEGRFNAIDVKYWLTQNGFKATGAGAATSHLAARGFIQRLEEKGHYKYIRPFPPGIRRVETSTGA